MVRIVLEEPRDPKNYPKTNVYHTVYGTMDCWAFYSPDVNEIRVIRQHNIIRTAYLLLHELGHWLICKIFNGENEGKVCKIHDEIDWKLTHKYFQIPPPEKRRESEGKSKT